ncbi:hypothetical protein B0J14DRAFT_241643 [Halenospora varia]|nr:hypothetical protein B0J14DRAFT_241643 [Halenospora varia]
MSNTVMFKFVLLFALTAWAMPTPVAPANDCFIPHVNLWIYTLDGPPTLHAMPLFEDCNLQIRSSKIVSGIDLVPGANNFLPIKPVAISMEKGHLVDYFGNHFTEDTVTTFMQKWNKLAREYEYPETNTIEKLTAKLSCTAETDRFWISVKDDTAFSLLDKGYSDGLIMLRTTYGCWILGRTDD